MADDLNLDTPGAVAAYLNREPAAPARAAQAAMTVAVDANPDLDAELRRVAARTGVPIDAARAYPEEVKRQAAVAQHDFDDMAQRFPSTTKFLSDPENARLSHDDVENLSQTEAAIGPIRGPKPTFSSYSTGLLQSFVIGADNARQGIRSGFADLYDKIGLFSPEANARMRGDAAGIRSTRELERALTTPEFEGKTAQGIYSGLSSTLRAAPGLAASLATRSATPMLAAMGTQTGADAYGKYRGRGGTPGEALAGGVIEGGVEVATEMLPMAFLVKNMGKVGAGSFLSGMLAREVPSEQIATFLQDAADTAIANPDKTWAEFMEERPAAAYETLIATLTQTGVMGGINSGMQRIAGRAEQAQQAAQVGEALGQFNDLATASRVRERDTSTAQAFFQSMMEDGRDTVWITPQALEESGMLEQLAQAIPSVAAQIDVGTGADVQIPLADLMATMASPELAQTIIPHLAEEPGGFTATTAAEYMQSGAAQELEEEVKRTLEAHEVNSEFTASRERVTAGVREQLTTAGRFSDSVNQAYASMMGSFYAVQAAKMGITPEEMAGRYPLQIRASEVGGGNTLNQAEPQRLEVQPATGKWARDTRQQFDLPWTKLKRLNTEGKVTADDVAAYKRIAKGKEANAVKGLTQLVADIAARPAPDTLNQSDQTVEVDGVRRPIHNSKGQKVAQTVPGQIAFWRWFGDSKVVDDQGRPLVVYHGTDQSFDSFAGDKLGAATGAKSAGQGFFFVDRADVAESYANYAALDAPVRREMAKSEKHEERGDWDAYDAAIQRAEELESEIGNDRNRGQNVLPLYLKITDAAEMDAGGELFTSMQEEINAFIKKAKRAKKNGVIIRRLDDDPRFSDRVGDHFITFAPGQIKSATGNDGTFDANDPSILSQPDGAAAVPRGTISFGENIGASPAIITLLERADLSTFLHESGHFFLEVLNDIANRPDAPADIVTDMEAVLGWFGVQGDPASGLSARTIWGLMDFEERRESHEKFARGFEAYLFEGRAPTSELSSLFSRFRSWLVNVYRSLTSLNVNLTDEVRGVFDRMLASADAIEQAERESNFAGLFGTKPDFMTDEEWASYRGLSMQAAEDASATLAARSLRDMQWLANAKSRLLRERQKEGAARRLEVMMEVRREVLNTPTYRAWQFLTMRGSDSTRAWPTREAKIDPKYVDTRTDNLYVAIAKLGGLNRDEVKTKWGVDHRDMPQSGVFGKPVLRKSGGLSIDQMAERLTQDYYLDAHDLAEFEEKFDRQRRGDDQYSWEYQYSNNERAPADPLTDSNYHGKLHTPMLRYMFGEDSPVVDQMIKSRMTSTDGGLDPDIVAEMLGNEFASGREMVEALAAARPPREEIERITDQRMLEKYGDLVDPVAIEQAIQEALHSDAHIKFLATELNALKKASGSPAVLAKAAKMYAEKIVRRTPIRDLKPNQYTAAARRAGKAADKAFKAGDIQEAAAQKQIQLVNAYAAQSAMEAQKTVTKTMTRFTRIVNGNNETAAKTRDMDMVMATRAILAEFGIGKRGKAAAEYMDRVQQYDPHMAAILRDRIDAATQNAAPAQDLTIEQLEALKDDIESLWHLAKRSRQMEVDGDLLDRQDIQNQLRARLEEIGVPDRVPGEGHAITPGEVLLSKFQGIRASLRRIESWVGTKDGDTPMGPFRKFVWNTIKDPVDAYRLDKAKYLRRYRELIDTIAPSLQQVKIAAPELGYTFGYDNGGLGKVELLHAILHTGNKSNMRKLLLAPRSQSGQAWAEQTEDGEVDTARWDAFIARMINEGILTKVDFDFAQGVWDMLEDMKPAAQKAHRAVFGRYFDEVTADAFTTPFGAYRGGYVPAMVDARIVSDAKTRSILEEQHQLLANAMPATSRGFTKSRVEYNRPLHLDLRLLAQHIDKVLLFTHLEQPIRDVRRILASDAVSRPLNRIDPAAYDELLTPWLNRTGLQQVETPVDGAGGKAVMRFFSVVRQRAGMGAMFANVSNTLQQLTGFSMAGLKVQPRHLLGASAQFVRAPRDMARAVAEASPYMRNRMENEVSAMTGAINDVLLNPGALEKAHDWVLKHTYFLQAAMDNTMGPIIWMGAYNQALETAPAGMSDEQLKKYARQLADSAIRETQGSTLPEDIARFETGNAFMRMFTQFASYFNMQANLLGTEFSKMPKEMGLRQKYGRGLYIMMFGFLAPAWVATAIALAFRGGPEDEDDDGEYVDDWIMQTFGWGTLRSATALVPGVGPTLNAAANRFNQKPYDDRINTGPAFSMVESAAGVPGDVVALAQGKGSASKTIRDVSTLMTLITGLPVNTLAKPIIYGNEVASGRVAPTGPIDAARGTLTGVASAESKGR